MVEKHIGGSESKEIFYGELEQFAREKIRGHLQDLLEQEVSEWLGREKSERKKNAVEQPGYRNGYGRPRRLTMSLGTLEIQRPRVRDLSERFKSKVLPMFKRQTQEVRELIPELYLHGLASGDFELALRHLLGDGAPLSASSLQRLKEKWQNEYTQWANAPIDQARWAYLWADGIYVKAGLGKEKAALLVVIGVKSDGSKCFLALEAGHRESKESWAGVLRQLKGRGLKQPRLFVGDGNLGLWAAVSEVYPQAQQQLCWNHKMLNVIDTVSRKEQSQVKRHVQAMMYAESREQALAERKKFEQAFRHSPKTIKTVVENWERLTTYYDYPHEHWKHLRTSNVVESPFSRVRLRTAASRRFKSSEEHELPILMKLRILTLDVILYRRLIAVFAHGAGEVAIAPKFPTPQLLLDLRTNPENFLCRDALYHSYQFRDAIHRHRLHQEMNVVLIHSYLQKLYLVSLLNLQTYIANYPIHCSIKYYTPVLRWKHHVV